MEEAVRNGDLAKVTEYIRVGSYRNEWKNDASLLVSAIEKGYEDIALALLAAQRLRVEDLCVFLDVVRNEEFEVVLDEVVDRLMFLVRAGASCKGLSQKQMDNLFRHACRKVDMMAVLNLLKSGCCVSSLSSEEQEELLHRTLSRGMLVDDMLVVQALLRNVSTSILSKEEQEDLLLHACHVGNSMVVDSLITNGCNVNCTKKREGHPYVLVYSSYTPLMIAAKRGHEELVKKLILADAKVGMQGFDGNTSLHYAAIHNHIQCGILLAEGGASLRMKNNFTSTPLDVACSSEFRNAIQQAASFTTRKTICIIGNAEAGKSTLIAALQAEKSSLFGKICNRFRKVDDNRMRTAGIETVPHSSQKYGEVRFFDFAGQHEYHGPHQMFLESLLSKPGVSIALLLVVKATEEEEAILHQLHRWLSPVTLMASAADPPQIIVIGSFLDKVKSKEESAAKLARCIEATRKDLDELPLQIVGNCLLNCRQPQSEGMDQLCKYLEEIPIPEFRASHTQYSFAWVLSQIRLSFKDQAVQLQELSKWIQDNRHNLPQTMPPPEEVCQDLTAAGHALYLPNKEDPPKGWLVLDLPSILRDVYGTLFSHSEDITNEVGLVHRQHLASLFPDLDVELVQQLLVGLEFCIPVDPSVLKVEVSKLTQSEDASGWLFFPALIPVKHPRPGSEDFPQQNVCYLCWQLETSKKHSISARVLQTILLRLAAHFVVKQRDVEGVQRHCCCIWWNGISWQSKKGVDVSVHITNNRVIRVVSTSDTSADKSYRYLSDVISDILSVVHQLSPNLAAAAYIVHPWKMATLHKDAIAPFPKELFPVEDVRNSIADHEDYTLSCKDSFGHSTRLLVSDLFGGWSPSLEDIGRILRKQPEPSQPQSPADHEPGETTRSPSSANPQLTTTAVSTVPTATATDRPLTPTASATDCPLTPTAAATDRSMTPTGAATDRPLTPTAAATDCPLTPTASSIDPLPTPTSPLQPSSPIPSDAQALLDTSAAPSLNVLNELITIQVAAKWPNLAIKLGVKDFLIDVISEDHPRSCVAACQDMLKRWLREERHTGGEERTWSTLLTALGRADFGELERSLRGEHFCN